jgi:hypothetical protein
MLLDEFLPEFDARASYGIRIAAPPDRVYASLRTADFDHWGLMRVLVGLRALPGLLWAPSATWRRVWAGRRRRPVTLGRLLEGGFSLLGERPGEELVLGTVGRFWRARGELWPTSAERFRESSPPGTAKAAWNFAVAAAFPEHTDVTTETRVLCADPETRRRFQAYWLLVGPFSGLIRREMLAAIRAAAEGEGRQRHVPAPSFQVPVPRGKDVGGVSQGARRRSPR